MSDTDDLGKPFATLLDALKSITQTIDDQKEAPEYIKKLVFHLSSLSASAQSLAGLLSRDFPSELKANLASIQDDIFECRDEIRQWSDRQGQMHGSGLLKIVPVMKPFAEGLVTALALHVFNSPGSLVYIGTAFLMLIAYFYLHPDQFELASYAWSNDDKNRFDELRLKIEHLGKTVKSYAEVQDRLKNSHRCDATLELNRLFEAEIAYKHGHSALSDEERNEAVQFWANKFGSEHYSVLTDEFIGALISRSFHGPLPESRRLLIYNAVRNVVDANRDGSVSVEEFVNVLFLFGPVSLCLTRLCDSLIGREGSKDFQYSWFSWLSLQRSDIDVMLPKQGDGVYVVRMSSQPYKFAVSYMRQNRQVCHSLIMASRVGYWLDSVNHRPGCVAAGPSMSTLLSRATSQVDQQDEPVINSSSATTIKSAISATIASNPSAAVLHCTCKSSEFVALPETLVFPSLAALVSAYSVDIFRKPFINWEQRVQFNVSGRVFETKMGLFFRSSFPTELGQMFGSPHNTSAAQDRSNTIFLDRNPDVFSAVLDWYRTGTIYIPANVSARLMQAEVAMFYRLPQDALKELEIAVQREAKQRGAEVTTNDFTMVAGHFATTTGIPQTPANSVSMTVKPCRTPLPFTVTSPPITDGSGVSATLRIASMDVPPVLLLAPSQSVSCDSSASPRSKNLANDSSVIQSILKVPQAVYASFAARDIEVSSKPHAVCPVLPFSVADPKKPSATPTTVSSTARPTPTPMLTPTPLPFLLTAHSSNNNTSLETTDTSPPTESHLYNIVSSASFNASSAYVACSLDDLNAEAVAPLPFDGPEDIEQSPNYLKVDRKAAVQRLQADQTTGTMLYVLRPSAFLNGDKNHPDPNAFSMTFLKAGSSDVCNFMIFRRNGMLYLEEKNPTPYSTISAIVKKLLTP